MTIARRVLSVGLALLAVLFAYVALTVPMFEAAGPAIFMVVLGVAAFIAWPRPKKA